jgi:hypothetical protein
LLYFQYSLFFHSIHSYHVLTRQSNHWSQFVSDDNPRGYNEKQKQRVADAVTLVKKRSVELKVLKQRKVTETSIQDSADDEYGIDCINAMIADIYAQYAAMGVGTGITHDADVAGTKDEEDAEDEDGDGDHEPQPSKRYGHDDLR